LNNAAARLPTESVKNANPVSQVGRWLLVLNLALILAGCGQGEPVKPSAPKSVGDYFTIKVGDHPVRMQLAVLMPEMQRGLMGRRELGADDGMMFVYARPDTLSFWMRNTPLPLDIGYFSKSGELLEIYALYPHDEVSVRSISSQAQFALEMNQGWFKRTGVRPGARLDLKALAAALRERGFEPVKFGLE
jgi:uncharacterized membrane protein (UPF0127 family)